MKRILLILITPIAFILVLWGVIDFFVLPKVSVWAKEEIESRTSKEGPVEVRVEKISLRLFRPSAEVSGLDVKPRGELAKTVGPIHIHAIRLRLNLFEIFLGRAEIAAVVVERLQGSLEVDPLMESKSEPRPLPMTQIFEWAEKIPLRRLVVENAVLNLHSAKESLAVRLQLRSLILLNRAQRLRLDAVLPEIEGELKGFGKITIGAAASLELTPKLLQIQELRLRKGEVTLRAQGTVEDVANLPVHPRLQMKAQADVPFAQVAREILALKPSLKLPAMAGSLQMTTDVHLEGTTVFESVLRAKTQGVTIGKFVVGDASLEGRLTAEALQIDHILLKHPAGEADLAKTTVNFKEPFAFKTEARTKALDMQELFQSLDLKEIPVDAVIAAEIPCEGEFSPLRLKCRGHAESDRLVVKGENKAKAKTIVALKDLAAEGETTITDEDVTFQAQLRVGGSRGQVKGEVSYEDGFRIDFKTPSMAFKDVENLADLHFEGSSSAEGFTEGNADAAIFEVKLGTKDFVFENFTLGAVKTRLRYKSSHLHFSDLNLSLGRTTATGEMDLDLKHEQIAGNAQSNAIDAADVVTVFSRIWKFPLELQGAGQMKMTFDGPLNFWKMNYNLETELKNGRLQGDLFDSLSLRAKAAEGHLTIEKAELRKNLSLARVTGGISAQKELNLLVDVSALRLEESEWLGRIRGNLSGQLNMASQIKGTIDRPDVKIRGSISDLISDEQEIPSSFFNFHITRDVVEGETNLLGNGIQGDLRIPLTAAGSPLRIRVKTLDWPFTSLLGLIGASALQNEYDSNLSADIDLQADSGRFQDLSGKIQIKTLALRRGVLKLQNVGPIGILLDRGQISLKDFLLKGPGEASLEVRGENFRLDKMDVNFAANTDLRLFQMFTPFLEDLGGPLQAEGRLTASLWQPQITGTAGIKNAFARLKGFPHPIEKAQAQIVFSQNKILIQDLRSQLAGGNVTGEGSVQINGRGDLPINIRLLADGLNLNVPDKVHTSGSADLLFSGRWFPYVLSGTYNVSSALVEMEFGGEDSSVTNVRLSNYLPKVLQETQFEPVLLDLRVVMDQNVVIKNSLMEGSVNGQLQIKGPPQNPILLGTINTEKGSKIIVKERPFEIQTGTVNFNNPEQINPELYISADARVEQLYDVNVLVQGLAKNPIIRLSSTPPLPESDLISLLALGVTSQQAEGQQRGQGSQVGYEALGIGLSKTGLKKTLDKNLGLDVKVTSSFDNVRNISVPKLSFTKKISTRFEAVYLKPMTSETDAQEFRLQYKINNNVSAIGSYDQRDGQEGVTTTTNSTQKKESIFGLDLQFQREFK